MSLAAGQTLSFYEILGPLGAGAMGEVWRARDTRLERDVAIKVLPEELAGDRQRLLRFEREAKTLASLNHPNIAGIHGVDRQGSVSFLALELVPGNDLATRLEGGPLPIDETVEICRQIADGLEAAHEQGIVHRDLKPANVRVTPEGVAKVLDFGLARRTRIGPGETDPTLSATGAVLGTPTYMSPEQVRGRPVDRRADIWAFGCVLFECLCGRRAFGGNSLAEVMSAVIEHEWDRAALPADTPPPLLRLLERCLDKDPRQRLRDIGEARVLLSRPLGAHRPAGGPRWHPWVWPVIAALVALVLGSLAGRLSVPDAEPISQQRLSEMAGMEEMPAISPGGTLVAFVASAGGQRQVFVRPVEGGIPLQITKEPAAYAFPRWIDDGRLLYLRSDRIGEPGTLYEVAVPSASQPRPIANVAGETDVSRDGRWLATFRRDDEGPVLVIIDRDGVAADDVRRMPPATYTTPRFSPDGSRLAFEMTPYLISAQIRVMELATGETSTLASASVTRGLAWLPDGSGLIYASSKGSTLTYPPLFTLRTIDRDGDHENLLPFGGAGYASYERPDVSAANRLVACRLRLDSDIYRYPVGPTPRENTAHEQRITHQTGLVQVPSVSPDGEEIVYLSDSGGHSNLWVQRVVGDEPPRPITDERDPTISIAIPVWAPNGNRIAYVQAKTGHDPEVWLVDSDGRGREPLVAGAVGPSWSDDGEWVYYGELVGAAPAHPKTFRISVANREQELVRNGAIGLTVTRDNTACYYSPSTFSPGEIRTASPVRSETSRVLVDGLGPRVPMEPHQYVLSPDGNWLAAPLKDGDTTNLYRISTADGHLAPVTDFGSRLTMIGRQLSWSPHGEWLYAAVMELDADIVLLDGALSR